MKRREFITVLGAAAAWPLVVRAQQPGRLPKIGFLGANTASAQREFTDAFVQRLRELGWIEGRNVAIEYRWAEGRFDRSPAIIAELLGLKIDIIVTHATGNVVAAMQATSSTPIVFTAVGDPVGSGLVASLARPGGNVTGLSLQQSDTAGKRLEILREIAPGLHRLAFLYHTSNPQHAAELREVQSAARSLGVDVAISEVGRAEDIAPAIRGLRDRAEALYVPTSPLFNIHRISINTVAQSARLLTIYGSREYVEAGGLVSFGTSFPDLFRRAGDYVDKILRGAKPADLPVERADKFELFVNLTTARALGLNIPELFLTRADRVIE